MELQIEQILELYDHKKDSDRKDVTSITSILGEELSAKIFEHYLLSKNRKVEILDENPIENKSRGKFLDFWIKEEFEKKTIYYQTEVKNWSSHSLGGTKLEHFKDKNDVISYAKDKFLKFYDYENKIIYHESVNKVLKTMKLPKEFENNTNTSIKPLICFWFPVLPKNCIDLEPFFSVESNNENFNEIFIFSISIYLRKLLKENIKTIKINLPKLENRLNKIKSILN
jgi:hypothetical protein